MSLSTPMMHRSAAVFARNRHIAQTSLLARRALNGDAKDNGTDQPEKPRQERLEDIFADLFADQPLPSLRPPQPEQSSSKLPDDVRPDWIRNSPSIETPRRPSSPLRSRQREVQPERNLEKPRSQDIKARFGLKGGASEPRKSDRSKMSTKETKAFHQILDNMYKVHSAPGQSAPPATNHKPIIEPETPAKPISARLGHLSTVSERPTPYEQQRSQPKTTITSKPVKPVMPAHEMEQEAYEEFDKAKETISSLGSDLEVWEWARENVFRVNAAETKSGEGDQSAFPSSYPLVLSYLIKLFREEFGNPHLAVSSFTLARSHSIQSYVAGCSTAAYNEALATYWKSFRNLRRVEECVKEMGINGVGWDRNTSKILSSIIEDLSETQLASSSTSFGSGQKRLEAEFGTEVLIRLAALERRVEKDVASKEKGVRMLLGNLAAERRRKEAASKPAVLPSAEEDKWQDDGFEDDESGRGRWDGRADDRFEDRGGSSYGRI